MSSSSDNGGARGLALVGTAVGEMVVPILIGVWVDNRYETGPWGLSIGAFIGIVGSFAHLILISRRTPDKPEKPENGEPPSTGTNI